MIKVQSHETVELLVRKIVPPKNSGYATYPYTVPAFSSDIAERRLDPLVGVEGFGHRHILGSPEVTLRLLILGSYADLDLVDIAEFWNHRLLTHGNYPLYPHDN